MQLLEHSERSGCGSDDLCTRLEQGASSRHWESISRTRRVSCQQPWDEGMTDMLIGLRDRAPRFHPNPEIRALPLPFGLLMERSLGPRDTHAEAWQVSCQGCVRHPCLRLTPRSYRLGRLSAIVPDMQRPGSASGFVGATAYQRLSDDLISP